MDDASKATWVYLMKEKSEVGTLLKGFVAMASKQFYKCVKVARSDDGLELKSGPMRQFYFDNGIIHQSSCVGTLQQNSGVERKHRYLLNIARALRFQLDCH